MRLQISSTVSFHDETRISIDIVFGDAAGIRGFHTSFHTHWYRVRSSINNSTISVPYIPRLSNQNIRNRIIIIHSYFGVIKVILIFFILFFTFNRSPMTVISFFHSKIDLPEDKEKKKP